MDAFKVKQTTIMAFLILTLFVSGVVYFFFSSVNSRQNEIGRTTLDFQTDACQEGQVNCQNSTEEITIVTSIPLIQIPSGAAQQSELSNTGSINSVSSNDLVDQQTRKIPNIFQGKMATGKPN